MAQTGWGRRFGIRRPRVGQAMAPPGGRRINPTDGVNQGPQDNVMDRRAYNGPMAPDRSFQIHQRMLGNGAAMSDADRADLSNNVAAAHRAAGNPVLTVAPKPMPVSAMAGARMSGAATQPVAPPAPQPVEQAPQEDAPVGLAGDAAAGQKMSAPAQMPPNGNAGTQPVNPGAVMAQPGNGGAGTQPVVPPTVQAPPGGPGSAAPPVTPNPGASNQTPNTGPGGPGTASAKDPSVSADGTNPPTQNPGESPTDYFARMKGWLDKYQADHGGAPPGTPPPPITGGPDQGFMDQQKKFYDDAIAAQGQADTAATNQAQGQFDLMMRRGQSRLQSVLAARGFGGEAASRGMQEISADAMNDFAKVQAGIAQNNAAMRMQISQNRDQAFQSAVGRVQDAQIQTQLMGYKSYYDRLSFNDQAGLQLALKAGDMETAFGTLRLQASLNGEQADLDRKWRTGERIGSEDFNKLMQDSEWRNRFISQKNEFNQASGLQLSDQEFQTKRQEAAQKWQSNERLSSQDFSLLSSDHEWSYRNAAQTSQFNHETGMQLSQFDFANGQRDAQNKFNHDERLSDNDWKMMMADKDFAHTVEMFDKQTNANLDIQDHAGYTQTLMTQGPAAALEFRAHEKQSRGVALSPAEQFALDHHDDKVGLKGDRAYQEELANTEWSRGLSMGLMQAYATTKDGQNTIENLFNNKDFWAKLSSGNATGSDISGALDLAGGQTGVQNKQANDTIKFWNDYKRDHRNGGR